MKRRKTCRICGELFQPYKRSYRRQKVCSRESCRKVRARELWRQWRGENLLSGHDRRKESGLAQKNPGYWREWRNKHPAAVERNREEQRRRNREKRSLIAKPRGLEWVHREKMRRIKSLQVIAKTKGIAEVFPVALDGIRRYFVWSWKIAKTKEMDATLKKVRECAPS
ncbi:MAG: hypothetical protein IPN90_05385 [Elusimicrobia bacterium]|nr:hypothetical protein [Elusimicrobiota bacterium]